MYVIDEDSQIVGLIGFAAEGFVFDKNGFVSAAEEVAPELVTGVDAAGECVLKPLHALYQIRAGGSESEVVVVIHEHPGKDFPARLLAGGSEGADKGAPVLVVEDDGFAAVSASKNVVDGSLILNPWRAWHDGD